jgi:hypothetical protein
MDLKTYSIGKPFDAVNIILKTIMGKPRYNFKFDENCFLNAVDKDGNKIFKCENTPNINIHYAEEIISKDNITEFKEYGKLFHEFGKDVLTVLTMALIRTCTNESVHFRSEDRLAVKKTGVAVSRYFKQFQNLIGLKDENDKYINVEQVHLNINDLIDDVDNILVEAKSNSFIEFGEILANLYGALTFYLTGAFISISDTLGININTFYSEGTNFSAADISDKLIKSNNIPDDDKYKLVSLIYTYYLLTNFYQKCLGFEFVDKLNEGFYKIGEKISEIDLKTLEEEIDISYLLSIEENRDSLMNFLNPPTVIKNPSNFDCILRDDDITDLNTIALGLSKYLETDYTFDYPSIKIKNKLFDFIIGDTNVSNSDVDILYNHFIENVANTIPTKISPKYFYKVTVYAAAFRALKKANKNKELSALGLYQAEAILALLFKEAMNEKYFRYVGTGIACKDIRYNSQISKARAYIFCTIKNYVVFVKQIEESADGLNKDPQYSYISLFNSINEINRNDENLIDPYNKIKLYVEDFLHDNYISDENYERFDEIVEKINNGTMSFINFMVSFNDEKYNHKYMNEVLENDYQQKAIDTLSEYTNKIESDYQSILDCRLARALTNNISTVIKNESTKERFDMYFNVFVKFTIPLVLAKMILDKSDKCEEDFLGNKNEIGEDYLPKINSQRLFNFMEK